MRPTSNSKLLLLWQGPYVVTKIVRKYDYLVKIKGKEKIYHANLLKRYLDRQGSDDVTTDDKQGDIDELTLSWTMTIKKIVLR